MWGLWDQNISPKQLVEATEMLCFAAKFMDDRKMHFYSVHEHGQKKMVKAAHDLLDEADVLLHYNGTRFDVPHLNREFITHGLTPPSPYQQIDLCRVVQRRFRFVSSKLEHVSVALGLKGKVSHEGFELWKKCLAGDEPAWKRMERYNRQDVRLLEEMYDVLQPWIPNHPHRGLYDETGGCPNCGSEKMQRRGYAYTRVSKYQRLQCKGCGAWSRGSHREGAVARQGVA